MIARDLIKNPPNGTARHGTARHGDGARFTPWPSGRTFLAPACIVSLLFTAVGCDSQATGTSTSSAASVADTASPVSSGAVQELASSDGTQQYIVDAGVVFVDEATYRCIPLSELGIESTDQIKSIKTSCDCLRVSTVGYQERSNKVDHALRIDFLAKSRAKNVHHANRIDPGNLKFRPILLATTVEISLNTGTEVELTVELAHTRKCAVSNEGHTSRLNGNSSSDRKLV